MSDIKVQDNFLSSSDFKELYELLMSGDFPWFTSAIVFENILCSEIDNWQLSHTFMTRQMMMSQSPFINALSGIIEHLDGDDMVRIKANLNPRTESIVKHGFHIDQRKDNVKASIFYVNSNDGYTEFEDGTRIESVANRLITFPYHYKHRGTTCTNKPYRMVINFNYF